MSINKENVKDIKYIDKIIDGTQNISYDNTTSGLSSNTIKDAIDELSSGGNYDFSVPNVYNTVPVRSETGTIAATSLIISTADGLKECGVWNDIDKTYDFNLINGSVGQLFQEAHICGKAYGNITNGQVCMFAGAQGDHILISPADTSTPGFRSEWIVGVATNDIDNGDFGYVTWFGKVNQLNTISNPAGTILYLNPAVNGGLTPTKPTAPNVKMSIAAVVRSHATEGSLMVRPNLGAYLGDLHDVHVDSPTDKNYLQYSTANSRWEATVSPTTLSGYGITDAYTKTEVNTAIANVVDSAPTTLDTLNELAAALNDDANFATTVATNIGNVSSNVNTHIANTSNPHSVTATQVGLGNVTNESKATMFTSPTFTGTVSGVTASMVGLGNVTNESKATMFTSPTFTGNAVLGAPASGDFSTGTFTWPTFNQNTSGNAATATKLATARTINGVAFDGTANITVADSTKVAKVTSTDNAVVRFDGTTGQVQNSGVIIDDSNSISTSGSIYADRVRGTHNTASGYGLRVRRDATDSTAILQFTNNAESVQLGTYSFNNAGVCIFKNDTLNSYTEFRGNTSVSSNMSLMKIHSREGSIAGGNTGYGVEFSHAGLAIDRCWANYPSITVFNLNNDGDNNTSYGEVRLHGTNSASDVYPNASGGDWSCNLRIDGSAFYTSDKRRKTNISRLDTVSSIEQIKALQPSKFNFISREGTVEEQIRYGFIAQEAMQIIPDSVKYYPEEDIPLDNGWCNSYSINNDAIFATAIEALKEALNKIEDLETRIATLEGGN